MPYVAPGLPPCSSIPKSILDLDEDRDSRAKTNDDDDKTFNENSLTPHSATSQNIHSDTTPQLDSSTMIPPSTSPSGGLSDSLSRLGIDAPPSAPSSDLPTASPTSIMQSESDLDSALDLDSSRRGSEHSTKTNSSLPALDPHSASSSSLASLDDSQVSTPGTTTGLTSPTAPGMVLGGGDREDGIARYREGLYAYTVSHLLEESVRTS